MKKETTKKSARFNLVMKESTKNKLAELAKHEERTCAEQIVFLIEKEYGRIYGEDC
jgi:hypothetical protein